MKRGKHYQDSAKLIERSKLYDPSEALDLVCKTAKAKFDETIELHVKLGVDSRHADQQVRGAVVLPHGTRRRLVRGSFGRQNGKIIHLRTNRYCHGIFPQLLC